MLTLAIVDTTSRLMKNDSRILAEVRSAFLIGFLRPSLFYFCVSSHIAAANA